MDGESDATNQQAQTTADESAQAPAGSEAAETPTNEPAGNAASTPSDAGAAQTSATLTTDEVDQLAALGYSSADIEAATTMLGAERAAEKFREHAKGALEYLRTVAPKTDAAPAKGAPQGAPATPKQSSPAQTTAKADQALAESAAGELLTADQIKSIGEAYGQEIVDGLVKPMQSALKAQTQAFEQRLASMEASLHHVQIQPALDGFDKAIKPLSEKNPQLATIIGESWDQATEEQFNARMQMADHAHAIRETQARRGIRITPAQALSLAVAARLGTPIPPSAAVKAVQDQVKNRSANRSIPPSAGKAKPGSTTEADPLAAAKQHVADFLRKNAGQ